MATTVVYRKPHPDGRTGTLFKGMRFWLSLNVPQRDNFNMLIEVNGGEVVREEKHADIKLVDHRKREIPLNTYSYKYVEKSVLNGRLEDLEAHRAGKSERPVGARNIPSRSRRTAYTLEDDQILWDWMQPLEARGDQVSGNVIYQQLEKINPRHTFQSYRDRYLKQLRGKPRPGGPPKPEQQQAGAQPLPAVRNVQFDTDPRTPEPAGRKATSRSLNQTSPAEASSSQATQPPRQPAQDILKGTKRRRLPDEDFPIAPTFATDNPAKRRRATEADPSTPDVSTTQINNSAGKPSVSFRSPSNTSSQNEDDLNIRNLWELPSPAQPAALGSAEEDRTEDAAEDGDSEDVEGWMEKHIRNGAKSEHVIMALDCTSMNAELADRVIVLLSAGHGIPRDMPGVWTKEDDEIVLGSDGRKIEGLLKKHGSQYYDERFRYLEERQKAHDVVMREEE